MKKTKKTKKNWAQSYNVELNWDEAPLIFNCYNLSLNRPQALQERETFSSLIDYVNRQKIKGQLLW